MRTRHRVTMWVAIATLPVACAVLYLNDPADGGIYPPCPFRMITGFDCPGCGTGRAIHQLLHGHLTAAVDLNLIAVALVPATLVAGLLSVLSVLTGRSFPAPKLPAWLPSALTGLVAIWFVVRNLPFGPLQWLASYR